MRELPGGTVTFLFTDIEGSTRLLHRLGDGYASVLGDHRRLLREAFTRHGGVEVDTQGDSFFVAFPDAGRAIDAAAEAQSALGRHPWPDGNAVRVRMGVHTGEPVVVDDHYVGIDVHRGARIAAAAHGGQVLVSSRTRELVATEALRDVGAHNLKDLPEPERLYQLVIEGLSSSFPPPRVKAEALEAAGLPDYSRPPADVPCPYMGLVAFQPEDADVFFGREQLVDDLVARLERAPFLAVVGSSGNGKSSLVRAGIVPALVRRDGTIDPALITPGDRPLAALAAAGDARLIVVDQFEEVFTLCRDEDGRAGFIDAVLDAADRGSRVVVALRADFYGHCAVYPRLAAALEDRQALVGPMREEELRRAIERPAEQAGLLLEPGLVEVILRDVVGEPGALPLLSHSLLETWKRRSGRMLTLIGYLQAGGVQGAVAKTAETVYHGALSPDQQALARNIFLRLTELGEGTEATRRRVATAELIPREEQAEDVGVVLRTLADARLVTIGHGTVEVAHEAVIRHWPTLRGWLDEDREGRLLHRRLTEAAREWDTTERDPALLFRGTRLGASSEWAVTHDPELNELEREFLGAGRAAEVQEIEATRRRNRRLRALLAGTAVALVLALLAGSLAFTQRNNARDTALTADAARLGAEALTEDLPDRALLLARAGVALEETARTRSNLLAALVRVPHAAIGFFRGGVVGDAAIVTSAVSPDGRVIAIGNAGFVTTFDTSSRVKLGEYQISGKVDEGHVQSVAFSPDGETLVVAGLDFLQDEPDEQVLDLLHVKTLERRLRVPLPIFGGERFRVANAAVAPDGRVYLLQWELDRATLGSKLFRIDGRTGGVEREVRVGRGAVTLLLTPDGRRIFVPSHEDDTTLEIDTASLRVVRRHPAGGFAGAVIPDRSALALGTLDGNVRLLDLRSGGVRVFGREHSDRVESMAFTPDGDLLVSSSRDGGVVAWNVSSGDVRERFSAHAGPVWDVGIFPDGRTLHTAGEDGRVILWDLRGDRRLVRAFDLGRPVEPFTPHGIAVSPDGAALAVTHDDGTVDLLDTATLQRRRSAKALPGPAFAVDFSPDGRTLAVAGREEDREGNELDQVRIVLLDAGTLAPIRELTRMVLFEAIGTLAFSPDGRKLAAAEVDTGEPRLYVWDVSTGTLDTFAPVSQNPSLAFSPDGRMLAATARDGGATEIRDPRKGVVIKRISVGGLSRSVAFSPDGSLLAIGQFDGDGVLYSTKTWRPVGRRLQAHTQRITSVEFTRDGRTLATASADGTVLLWDVATQAPIGTSLAVGPDTSAALSPDGSYLFAISDFRGLRLSIDPEVWKRHACLVAGRSLTESEWSDALPGRPFQRICA